MNRTKKIIYTFFTLLLFLFIIALVEILLRFTFPSLDNPFVKEVSMDNTAWFEINRLYLTRYFPSNSPLIPELKPTLFLREKKYNTYRIVCIGSSSMFGTPYQLNANIPGIVRKQLRHMYPEKEIEVINLGAAAINSNVMLDLSKKIINYNPDLVLIYMGHNEFYGPDGVGASWLQKIFPSTIQLKYTLNDLWLVKAFDKYFFASAPNLKTSEKNLMKQVSHQSDVHLNSEDAERIFHLFKENTHCIIELFQKNNIPVIISDLSSNLGFPPFMYDTSVQLLSHQAELSILNSEYNARLYIPALHRGLELLHIDSSNAYVNYIVGKIYLGTKQPEKAKRYLRYARDEDLFKFRAPSRINTIIAQVATEQHVPFISTDSLFCSLSTSGVPDSTLFREHLHPNAYGYYEIANLFVKKVINLKLIPEQKISSRSLLPFNYNLLNIPWLDIAYGDFSIQHLTSQWPFQNYHSQMYINKTEDNELLTIATNVYRQIFSLTEGCYKTATRLQQLGRFDEAIATYGYLSEEYPRNYYPYFCSGTIYKDLGMIRAAIHEYELSVNYNPFYIYSHIDLGLLKINNGKFDEAITHFQTAEHLASRGNYSPLILATIYYGLSAAYANKNNFLLAKEFISKSIRLAPTYEAAKELNSKLHSMR